jgi:hypothetical protein
MLPVGFTWAAWYTTATISFDKVRVAMSAIDILDTAQYVVDKDGRQTAVLLDLSSWQILRQLLEELAEDEKLGELLSAVQDDEKLEGEAAQEAYQAYLQEVQS